MWIANGWKDYEVIDCSGGEKLERWGKYILVRPDPQVIWDTDKKAPQWRKMNGHYHRSSKGGGDPNIDTREGSMIQTAIGPTAWYLEGVYMILKQIQDNAYPATAVGDCLDKIVQTRGLTRKQATAAVRKGTFNTAVPSGSEFKTINGAD